MSTEHRGSPSLLAGLRLGAFRHAWSALFACVVAVSIVLAGCSASRPPLEAAQGTEAPADLPPPVPLREKLDTALLGLIERHAAGGTKSVLAYAASKGIELNEMRVSVRVLATSEQDVDRLEQEIRSAGGDVWSRFENSIFAELPVAALGAFAAREAVWRMDMQRSLSPPAELGPTVPDLPKEIEE